jgi:alpha-beta hydrolase superfamily lysophospholipase
MMILAGIGILLAVLVVVWLAVSYHQRHQQRAAESTLREYQVKTSESFGVFVDWKRLERDVLDVNGIRLSLYILSHRQGAPTLVFMPGTAVWTELYAQFLYDMNAAGFNVVGYDPRGHGRTSGPRGAFTIGEMVEDAAAVCEWAAKRFGGKVVFSGSSQGGVVGFYLAARETPSLAASFCHNIADLDADTILEISAFKPPKFLVKPIIRLFGGPLRYLMVPVTFYLPFRLRLPGKPGQDARKLLADSPLSTTWYSLGAVGSLGYTKMARPVDQIRTPVLLLGSSLDEVFPPAYEERIFRKLTCRKTYVNLEGEYHLILLTPEQSGKVLKESLPWLREVLGMDQVEPSVPVVAGEA